MRRNILKMELPQFSPMPPFTQGEIGALTKPALSPSASIPTVSSNIVSFSPNVQ
eukprot:TRINITY_DN6281_c0_g1_i1.p1 TRINITY_DN6281_c0_g1~~TRINITY_DN6281_c0_g1_i1.p1  ORF type:complete len:54 (+),score=5.03 TRINITY_DN6281_c0_g1_i1:509-670(+)